MKDIILYTDGACSGNPGVGGYGYILFYKDKYKEFSGVDPETTNNKMEITAVIKGLNQIKEPCNVTVYTDSAYTMNAFEEKWIDAWIAKGWKTANNKPVKNVELWQELIKAMSRHNSVQWVKVKGHSDNKYNNRCDELARSEIEKWSKKEYI
ncbi:MAG: ribonuclease HI [Clostridiales bacterium]|nr:ribonuclease HI [Clostridiales bacterium]